MTQLRRKRVSDEVMVKIVQAIGEIAVDDRAPRTKREIEHRTGLSHDAVARAFRQDSEETNSWSISEKLASLTDGGANRRSPARKQKLTLEDTVRDLRERLADSEHQQHRYAMALYAYHLSAGPSGSDAGQVVPLGRNRPKRGSD